MLDFGVGDQAGVRRDARYDGRFVPCGRRARIDFAANVTEACGMTHRHLLTSRKPGAAGLEEVRSR